MSGVRFVVEGARAAVLAVGRARARKRRKGVCDVCGARGVYVIERTAYVGWGRSEQLDVCALCRREGY